MQIAAAQRTAVSNKTLKIFVPFVIDCIKSHVHNLHVILVEMLQNGAEPDISEACSIRVHIYVRS